MSPAKLVERTVKGIVEKASARKATLALLLIAVIAASLLQLPMAKADVLSYAPPYPGKYESGFSSGGWLFDYWYVSGKAQDGGASLVVKVRNAERYAYAGYYTTINVPSDAVELRVKAVIRLAPTTNLWGWGDLTLSTAPWEADDSWAGLWFNAAIDSIPVRRGSALVFMTVRDLKARGGSYRISAGAVWTPEVKILNPPAGAHRLYFGLVAGAKSVNWLWAGMEIYTHDALLKIESLQVTIVRKTAITVEVDPKTAEPGQLVKISGQLTAANGQPLVGEMVRLGYYASPYQLIDYVRTKEGGRYDYDWKAPSTPKTYTVEAYFPGSVDLLPSRATTTLTVQQAAHGFTVSVSPSSATAYSGQAVSTTVYVKKDPYWPHPVSLSVSGGSINPSSGVPDFSATWTITAPSAPGTYTYTVTASSQGVTKQATFTLTVQQPQPSYDFKVSISPSYVEVDPGKAVTATVYVSPTSQYPYTVSLSVTSGSVSPSSGRPHFTAAWSLTAPGAPGDYIYRVTGYGGDGKVRHAELHVKVRSASLVVPPTPSVDYYQGYVEHVNHYYAVDDLRLEARFASPIDWRLEHEGSYVKTMRKGDKDSWSSPNKLAFGDFFVIDVYVKLREYTTTTTQNVNKYYYNGAWHDSPPSNGNFKGYMKYDEKHSYYKASVTVTASLPKELFWTIDQGDPLNKAKCKEGCSFTISKSELSGDGWIYLGSTSVFRVKSPKEAGASEGSPRDVTITVSYSWSNGKDSKSSSKPFTVRLSWIKPEVQQAWSSPFSCTIRVYGVWADDGSKVKGRPYLYYGLDLDGSKRLYLKTGMASNGDSYAESGPVDPQSLRPTGYAVNKAVKIPLTPAIEDFGLVKGEVEYRELAIAVYQRDSQGIKLRVYEFKEPYNSVANAKVTLMVKDLSSGKVKELTKATDSQGYASFTRSELSLPSSYELWAIAWGASAKDVIYGRSSFGCVLLERSPTA